MCMNFCCFLYDTRYCRRPEHRIKPKATWHFLQRPKISLTQKIDWSLNYDLISKGVLHCQTKWAKKNHVPQTVLDEWVSPLLSKFKSKATKLLQRFSFLGLYFWNNSTTSFIEDSLWDMILPGPFGLAIQDTFANQIIIKRPIYLLGEAIFWAFPENFT